MLAIERRLRDLFERARGDHLRSSAGRLARRLVDEERGKLPLEIDLGIRGKQSGDDRRSNVGEAVAGNVGAGRVPEQHDLGRGIGRQGLVIVQRDHVVDRESGAAAPAEELLPGFVVPDLGIGGIV